MKTFVTGEEIPKCDHSGKSKNYLGVISTGCSTFDFSNRKILWKFALFPHVGG